jgi:5-methylcytosine-specific restriction endonuclease McrA
MDGLTRTERQKRYHAYLRSPEWRERRRVVLARAGGRCERCKLRKAREVHHLTYVRIFNEPPSDLQALCGICHDDAHGIGGPTKAERKKAKADRHMKRMEREARNALKKVKRRLSKR